MDLYPFLYANDPSSAWASQAAAQATGAASRSASATDQLSMRTDRLVLVVTAMWSLLREKTNLSEQDLETRVREIDLRDGRLDGKVSRHPASCAKCGRALSPRHASCFYCGGEIDRGSALDAAR